MQTFKPIRFVLVLFFLSSLVTLSCNKLGPGKSSDKQIITFVLTKPDGTGFVSSDVELTIGQDTIQAVLPAGVNLNGLIPNIQIKGLSISPATGIPQDFSKPVIYTVTATDSSYKNYIVIVSIKGTKNTVFFGSGDKNFYAVDAITGKTKWKYTGNGEFSYASPAVYNGMVYAGCTDNNVYAFDIATGNSKWKFATGGAIESSFTVQGGIVYAGSDDDYMYALDATTGALKWKFLTGQNVSSSAVVSNGVAYFGSSDANVYALNIADGSLKWKFTMGSIANQSGVALSNGIIFIGSRDGYLYAINAANGALKWKYFAGGVSLEESTPVVVSGKVYIGGWYIFGSSNIPGSVYAVDELSGSVVWSSLNQLGFSSSPYIADSTLYISADDGSFYALNANTGATLWSKKIYPNGAGGIVSNGIVYVGGGGSGYFYAFSAESGNELWKLAVGNTGFMTSTPCVIDGNGTIYNFRNSRQPK